jgi:NAD(P)H-dependent FMN reductase
LSHKRDEGFPGRNSGPATHLAPAPKMARASFSTAVPEPCKLLVILGSTRQGRFGDTVANWIAGEARKRSEFNTELVDLRDHEFPYFSSPTPPSRMAQAERPQPWSRMIDEADAFVIVTPEYNHGYTAVLKSALDAVYEEWGRKPMAVVCYGGLAGGARAAEQLRLVAVELQMVPTRWGIVMPLARMLFDEGGQLKDPTRYEQPVDAMFDDLAWWAQALREARAK